MMSGWRVAPIMVALVLAACVEDAGGPATDAAPESDAEGNGGDANRQLADSGADAGGDATPDCVPAGAEVCNGRDDDCNGVVDDGFDIGGACTAGEGACAREGVTVCGEDGQPTCDAAPGDPAAEACNGLDDDCDGTIDEGFDVDVFCDFRERSCVNRGRTRCKADGSGVECDAEPIVVTEELCDGRDNDCDGMVDEGIELGAPCEEGVGLCRRGGFVQCGEDGRPACSARPGQPRDEECNGFDDDCDGTADEDFGGGACAAGVGACRREGVAVCGPEGLVCNAVAGAPGPERCNGEDDDCDGTVDEGYVEQLGQPCMSGVGACARPGTYICDPEGRAAAAVCDAAPGAPAPEVCNGIDDDCDGTVDERIPGVGEACVGVEVGLCQRAQTVCADDGAIVCAAVDLEPQPELCNQQDDDCDGSVDEDFPQIGQPCTAGEGACAAEGVFACGEGRAAGLEFAGIRQNLAEREVLEGGFEECWRGRYHEDQPAVADVLARCGEDLLMLGCRPVGAPALTLAAMGERAEILTDLGQAGNAVHNHNGVDWYFSDGWSWGFAPQGTGVQRNSCDVGQVQGELRMCWHTGGGRMNSGYRCGNNFLNGDAGWERIIYHRPAGAGVVCEAEPLPPAGAELCNAIDDDCDGRVDEEVAGVGEPCDEGVGFCQAGRRICRSGGRLVCEVRDLVPSPEVCNGLDDDCNGVVDDVAGIGDDCVAGLGVCARPGVLQCSEQGGGGLQFAGIRQNVPERELLDGRFELCWRGLYGEDQPRVAQVLQQCDADLLLLGCRRAGAPELALAAMGERAEILTDVGDRFDAVHNHNGVDWYFSDSWSWGFAPQGTGVQRNSCDTGQVQGEQRMCWHTGDGSMNSGYRCGDNFLNGDNGWERLIYQRVDGPGLACIGEPGPPAGAEQCNGLDDDCDGEIDEGFGLGDRCEVGRGACRRVGVEVCDDEGEPTCSVQPGEPGEEECNGVDDDCDGRADEDLDCPFFASCQAALDAGNDRSGVFPILAAGGGVVELYCDMTTDGGGWTLVASTAGRTLDDYGVAWYADLATLAPAQANPAIYNGLALGPRADVRFACRDARRAADAPMTVDLSFYDVPWYAEFAAAANDGQSCFSEENGAGQDLPPPARRDNVGNRALPVGAQWAAGYLEGEDFCGDEGDFTVDFDDRGMDNNQSDGTDWGEDDGSMKCGRDGLQDGQWFIFAREVRPRP